MPDSKEAIEKLEDLGAIVVEGESGLLVSLDETNVDEVIPLLRLKNVVDLEFLHSCGISNHHLKEFRNNSSVKKLAFHANFGLSEYAFSVLPTFGALEELILKVDMDLDPEPVFKNVGACKKLIKLLLIFPKSDDAGRHLRFLTKLRDLKMKSQLQDLSFVRQMESLTHLNVGDNPIGDEDLLSIRCFKSLQDLSLFNTDISDKCGPTFSKFLNLESLLVSGTRVSTEILPHLIALPKLTDLGIWNSNLGQDSIPLFAQMKRLKMLMIPEGLFSSSQLQQLCAQLPSTRVTEVSPPKRRK